VNNDGVLSINEFSMFVEGAKVSKQQRLAEIDPKIIEDLKQEIETLFKVFDRDNSGKVSAYEIMRAMEALGHRVNRE